MTPSLVAELRTALGPEVSVAIRSGGPVVVSDGRPATPDALRAALRVLVETVRRPELGGRGWAVVGRLEVAEDDRIRAHDEVGRLAVRLNVHRLVAVGLPTRAMHAGAVLEGSFGEESVHVPDAGSAVSLVLAQAGPRDVVLVVGGRDDDLVATVTAALTAEEDLA